MVVNNRISVSGRKLVHNSVGKQINVHTCLHSYSIQQQFYSATATVTGTSAVPTQLSYIRLVSHARLSCTASGGTVW